MLTNSEKIRYTRQILLFKEENQIKLKGAKIFVAGVGGLGCPASMYLAVAGIGKIKIIDKDRVDLSNLNRQVLHWEKDINKAKVSSAIEKLKSINPDIEIEAIDGEITEENAISLINGCDGIFDAMDNFETRFILNKVALDLKIPLFHGSIYGLEGRATTIIPGRTVCLNCIFREAPPKETFPVIGTTPGLIAMIQATEVIKYFTSLGKLLENRYFIYNGIDMTFRELKLKKDPDCLVCGVK
ncbi:MAG: HesA/MoeB/ThiF family protein [bacterium]